MSNSINLLTKLAGIVISFSVLIYIIYAWVLPEYFSEYKTYGFLVLGILNSFGVGVCCSFTELVKLSLMSRCFLSFASGVIVATLVLLISLFIIVNIRGT